MTQELLKKLADLIENKTIKGQKIRQADVADELGLTQPHFSMILNGKRNVTTPIAQGLEKYFGRKVLPWEAWFKDKANK